MPVAVGFQIKAIRVNSFAVNEAAFNPEIDVGFGVSVQHLFDTGMNEHVVQVELSAGHSPDQPPLIVLHVECQYQLTGYQDWFNTLPDEQRTLGTLPQGLAMALNSISISTVRGILFERLRGTDLQHIVLPIIDPSVFQPAI